MLCEFYNMGTKIYTEDISGKEIIETIALARAGARKMMLKTDKTHVLYAIHLYNADDEPECIRIFKGCALSDTELDALVKEYPRAIFDVLHSGTHKKACEKIVEREKAREIHSINLKVANRFVNMHHRHHKGSVGCKFSIGLYDKGELIGVAICGRPVSRYLDNGDVCEITRLCTTAEPNSCSILYGACCRIAREMGYKKIITYILQSESGASLKASNFTCEGIAGGTHWTGKRNRGQDIPAELKTRWSRKLA